MANTTSSSTRLKLEEVLKNTTDPVALEQAKQQLNAAELARPADYQQSQDVQNAQLQLTQKEQQRPQQYQPSQAVQQAQQNLNGLQKPGEWQSRYETQVQGILDTINNRKEFTYNAAEDPMYQTYRDQYLRLGQRAAQDAQANAAALTGGYGSSYGQMVANQQNQAYLAELNSQVPTLMQLAYQRYQDQQADYYNQLAAFQGQDQYEYGQYRDKVSDYYTDRDYLAGRYDTEYSKDYQQYRDSVGDFESELNYLYQKYGDMSADDYQKYLNNMDLWLQDRDYYLEKHGLAQDQANWQTEWDYATQKNAAEARAATNTGATLAALAANMEFTPSKNTPGVTQLTTRTQAAKDLGKAHYVMDDGTVAGVVTPKGTQTLLTTEQQEEDWTKYLTEEEKRMLMGL